MKTTRCWFKFDDIEQLFKKRSIEHLTARNILNKRQECDLYTFVAEVMRIGCDSPRCLTGDIETFTDTPEDVTTFENSTAFIPI